MGLKGGSSTQTNTTGIDAKSQTYLDAERAKAQQIGNAPVQQYGGPLTLDQNANYGAAADTFGKLAGFTPEAYSADAIKQRMDPYQQQVIDASMADYDVLQGKTMQGLNQDATNAGAFGNDRRFLAQGEALSGLGRGRAAELAGLRSQGFLNAQGQFNADRSATMQGLYANQSGANGLLNAGQAQDANARQNQANQYNEFQRQQAVPYQQLDAMRGAMGPYGQTSTSTQTQKGSILGTIGGLASLGAAFIPGLGPVASKAMGAAGGIMSGNGASVAAPPSSDYSWGASSQGPGMGGWWGK